MSNLHSLINRQAANRQQLQAAIGELVEALRLTVEYVGTGTLRPLPGWSWYDALSKHAPDVAAKFSDGASGGDR
jgi:hypothetical protein